MSNKPDLRWKDFSREDLVKEYLETKLATIIEHVGTNWYRMPTDVSRDPAYWKSKDKSIHDMHCEIARRYHISRNDCLWLENIVDSDNLYIMDYKFKVLINETIKCLEKKEKEQMSQ